VSVSSSGEPGDGAYGGSYPAISADGRFVAFHSDASNLVPDDTNHLEDIFVHDRFTGETTRVSIASGGQQANAAASQFPTTISADGRFVAFSSEADNLVSGDTNRLPDVFVHGPRIEGGQRESGVQLTPDGRHVLISKDVAGASGTERWSITRHLDDGSVTGNVFPSDGGKPSFVFCTQLAKGTQDVTLECSGADACIESPCLATQWASLGTISVPTSFLEPPTARY
jgi:hypothetical protein